MAAEKAEKMVGWWVLRKVVEMAAKTVAATVGVSAAQWADKRGGQRVAWLACTRAALMDAS